MIMNLIQFYSPSKEPKTLNYQWLCKWCDKCITKLYNNIKYQTIEDPTYFYNLNEKELKKHIQEQEDVLKKEAEVLLKFNYLTKPIYEKTLEQIDVFYYYENHCFIKSSILSDLITQNKYENTYTIMPTQNQTTIKISREAIRNITKYSPYVIPKRDTKEHYIQWQDDLLKDEHKIKVALGSRQIWKCKIATDRVKLYNWWYKEVRNLDKNDILIWSNYEPIKITQLIKWLKKECYKITYDNWYTETFSKEHRIAVDLNFNPITNWEKNRENYKNIKYYFDNYKKNDYRIPFLFDIKNEIQSTITKETAIIYWWLSKDKFIDNEIFKQWNEVKYWVLDWLLNTDWYLVIQKNNTIKIEYCSVSERLIDDIFLIWLELWLIFKKRFKKIKSNDTYYIDIQDINSIKKIIENTNLSDKKNYKKFVDILDLQKDKNVRIWTISAKKYITRYNFQRDKYSWHWIKNIEYVWEQDVVSIWVGSDDELFFWAGSLTHNSFCIAELCIEESFIPNSDLLVWAYTVKTTNVIRNYILKKLEWFQEWLFDHHKSEWYILNTQTGTKIHFRTLWEWWNNILWLTLKNIVVDEAQLVDDYVFNEVLRPTLLTTWW